MDKKQHKSLKTYEHPSDKELADMKAAFFAKGGKVERCPTRSVK